MSQSTYIARKDQDADFAALTCDSLVVNTTTIAAGAITLADGELITAGTGSDVTIQWDSTNFLISAAADDSVIEIGDSAATQKSFDVKVYGQAANGADYLFWDASASAFKLMGDARIDASGATVLAANTDGGVIKVGDASTKVIQDTADMKFVSFYWDNGATSGDSRGIYNRLYITGAGGGGESFRTYTDVENVAGATAHGAHISLGFGTSGSLTGQGIAMRGTLHMPSTALPASNVTYSAVQAEIYSDATTSDPSGNLLSFVRLINGGDATGGADVDDDAAAFELSGFTVGAGNVISANTAGAGTLTFTNWSTLRCRVGTTVYYIPIAQTIAATA